MSETTVLRAINLKKHFGPVRAVEDVSLHVRAGEVYGFLGPNGSGKTTTIGMLLGLLRPTAGQVEVLGQPVTPDKTASLRQVGVLVGGGGLIPYLSGRDNLLLLRRLHPGVGHERVEEVMAQVGLAGAAGRKVEGYSLGMRQRLGLAGALLHRPRLLILDEPTNGLDPAGMHEVRGLLRRLADEGVTVFLSSHLLHEVEQVCDRVAVLNKGRVVAEGAVASLLAGKPVIRVRVAEVAAATEALRTLGGVTQVAPNGHYVEVTGVSGEAVVAHLAARGIFPGEVTLKQSDLESIFLSLTQA